MSETLDPLIYAYFSEGGLTALASSSIPFDIQQVFIEDIVTEYWDATDPPPQGFRAAFLRQMAPDQSLFGWLYSDIDEQTQGLLPCALGYYLNAPLTGDLLQLIFGCLERGPLSCPNLSHLPEFLEEVAFPSSLSYEPARPGVPLPSGIYARSRLLLVKQRMLDIYIPYEPELEVEVLPSPGTLTASSVTPPPSETWLPAWDAVNSEPMVLNQSVSEFEGSGQKMALLIGVNGYGEGFRPLMGVEQDVQAMAQVLASPGLGGFTQVKTLLNPDCQVMSEAIESLFLDSQPEDLILLYLSGYCIRDRQGNISLATGISRRGRQQKVIRSTVIPANFMRTIMDESSSQQQVLVLDCCFADAFPRETPTAQRPPKVESELGGSQRLILSTCTTSGYTTAQKEQEPSLYTRYLVEGLATGAADVNHDGIVTLYEWHDYARQRTTQAAPVMMPQCYGATELQNLGLIAVPSTDPRLKYRKHVERGLQDGDISALHRTVLDSLQVRWGITSSEASTIEAEVLQPYSDYRRKIQAYAQQLLQIRWQPVNGQQVFENQGVDLSETLLGLQESLGLTSTDTQAIEAEIEFQFKFLQALEPAMASQSTSGRAEWRWLQNLKAQMLHSLSQVGQNFRKLPGWGALQAQWQQHPRRLWLGGGSVVLLLVAVVVITVQGRQRARSQQPATLITIHTPSTPWVAKQTHNDYDLTM
ncbi:hypothetical protein GS597_18110 [Synechococcales cyanobacterium C]|uniref:Peptidase C14 caspase domain-containing protein n=1 Tax=Petrachloros mirabilis ULC683 TaxID=2781853 RepID=A0A8K2A212_9CYAN|nr:caspase family protein [Petrachloros mirabilis]NCJ08386.1 hypothetical protein [Petrachloros mirabilis ULC683]